MHFLPEAIDQYSEKHSQEEPQLLKELNRATWLRVLQPRMLSGAYQGRVLSILSKLIAPKRILEIGTYTGYSALCLAEGLQKNGELITIDRNEELEDIAAEFFERSDYVEQIKAITGNAMEVIPELEGEFDLVFIDADKVNYIHYFQMVIDKLRPGGVILSDNVLWSGKVVETLKEGDRDTEVLLEYNRMINEDPRVETVLLPIRDGLTITRKIIA